MGAFDRLICFLSKLHLDNMKVASKLHFDDKKIVSKLYLNYIEIASKLNLWTDVHYSLIGNKRIF